MSTHHPYLEMFVANDRGPVAKSAAWKYRRSTSVLFAAIGIVLGTLTGLAVAILGTSASATGLSIVSANTDSTGLIPRASSGPTRQAQSTSLPQFAESGRYTTDEDHRAENNAATGIPKAFRLRDVERSNRSHFIRSRATGGGKPTKTLAAYRRHHPARSVNHPLVMPAHIVKVNVSHAGPPQMNLTVEQLNHDDEARSSNLYIEGDITVVDFDAAAGTIETSDGKTFVVGITVTASNAASWDEFRSNLHYRCSATGSCSLSRAGAVAPNARLI